MLGGSIVKKQFYGMIVCLALLLPLTGTAENSTQVGGYTVHHSAFTTDTLSPQIAKNYGIQRSKHRGMLNVSVIKDAPGTTGRSTQADIKVMASDLLTGHARHIDMREIKEENTYYYIGDFPVANQETLNFTIEVKPQDAEKAYTATLSQQFFTK
jgi:hypothetical protein